MRRRIVRKGDPAEGRREVRAHVMTAMHPDKSEEAARRDCHGRFFFMPKIRRCDHRVLVFESARAHEHNSKINYSLLAQNVTFEQQLRIFGNTRCGLYATISVAEMQRSRFFRRGSLPRGRESFNCHASVMGRRLPSRTTNRRDHR